MERKHTIFRSPQCPCWSPRIQFSWTKLMTVDSILNTMNLVNNWIKFKTYAPKSMLSFTTDVSVPFVGKWMGSRTQFWNRTDRPSNFSIQILFHCIHMRCTSQLAIDVLWAKCLLKGNFENKIDMQIIHLKS